SSTARPTGDRGIDNGFVSTVDAEARRQRISEVGYGIRDTWVDPVEADPKIAPTTLGEVSTRVLELAELYEHDTQDMYALLEDAQDGRTRISQRVAMDSQRVDLLVGDRMTLQETVYQFPKERASFVSNLVKTKISNRHIEEAIQNAQQVQIASFHQTPPHRQLTVTQITISTSTFHHHPNCTSYIKSLWIKDPLFHQQKTYTYPHCQHNPPPQSTSSKMKMIFTAKPHP
ncbi:hypothetical protein Tco_1422642, partial [Tanacetum coccineum]